MGNIRLSEDYALRAWIESDVDSFINGCNHPEILGNLRPEFPNTRDKVSKFIKESQLKESIQDFAIINKKEEVVGGVSLIISEDHSIELAGLWVAEGYWGQGISSTITKFMIVYLPRKYPGYCIRVKVCAHNEKQIHILKKLGFKKTGNITALAYNGENKSLYCYEYPQQKSLTAISPKWDDF